jgi:cytochrome c553
MRARASYKCALGTGVVVALSIALASQALADMTDTSGMEPWEGCGDCHGLDGAGNRVKFPRIAGLKPDYIVKQLNDFRSGHRTNDGGQMQKMMTGLNEGDLDRIAEWFADQMPPWPTPTLENAPDSPRVRQLAVKGGGGFPSCISCHSATAPELADRPDVEAGRIAGQRDYYIAKQLTDFRDGRRGNDAGEMMQRIARSLSDEDIAGLAAFLSQNPALHEATP